jgi:threonyl-tRNA synthetase
MLIYKNSPKSYKDLPLRVGELGVVHRQELSGVLGGLFRVIQFTQDDAHIYCTEEQLESEIVLIIELVKKVYDKLGINLDHVELSTRPEKRIGSDEIWDKAEKALESVLKKLKMKYKINEGDGAFYGPKIDYHVKDSLGRTWQTGTIQLDMAMPERFDLEYTDKDNSKKRPIMLHRTILGSLERFLGVLIEDKNGRLPTWLSPVQVRILSFTDRNIEHSKEVVEKMKKTIPSLRIETDFDQKTIQSKVKEAEMMKIPYIIVIGDKEERERVLAIRKGGENTVNSVEEEEFIFNLKEEIENRR